MCRPIGIQCLQGICKLDSGFTVLVDNALPGEHLEVCLTTVKKRKPGDVTPVACICQTTGSMPLEACSTKSESISRHAPMA